MDKELFQKAKELFTAGNFHLAVEKFRTLYENDKKNAEINYYLGLTLLKQDHYDEALKFLEQAQKIDDTDYRIYEALGEAYGMKAQRAGGVKAAFTMPKIRKSFQKAIELNHQALKAHEGLFMFYLFVPSVTGGDEKKAVALIDEIKMLNKSSGYLAEGIYERKHNNLEKATAAFNNAAENGPDNSEVQMKVGRFFLNNNMAGKAGESFDRYIALKPDDAAGYTAKGELLLQEGNASEAVKTFNKALELNQAYFPALFNRAKALQQINRKPEAESDLKEIIRKNPNSPQAAQARRLLVDLQG